MLIKRICNKRQQWRSNSQAYLIGFILMFFSYSNFSFASDPASNEAQESYTELQRKESRKRGNVVLRDEINVTAAAPIGKRRLSSLVPQAGISRDEFEERNNRRLGDVIQQLPGLLVDGPPGENKDVRLRGLDKEFTRIQVDGIQLPDGGEKREFQVNQIPSFLVDQVNIIRNPTADFESDGLAGRVDVKTRAIPLQPRLEGRFGYGGRNNINGDVLHGTFGYGYRPLDWFGGTVAFDYLENLFKRDKNKVFSTGKNEVENEREQQRSINLFSNIGLYYGRGEFNIKPLFLDTDSDRMKTKTNSEPTKNSTKEEERENKNTNTTGVTINHRHTFAQGAVWESVAGYFSSTEDKDKSRLNSKEAKPGSNLFNLDKTSREVENKEDETFNYSTFMRVPFRLGVSQELKFGGAFRQRNRHRDKDALEIDSKGVSKSTVKAKDNLKLSEQYVAGFIMHTIWLTERFSILPGVRVEHVDLRSSSGDGSKGGRSKIDVNPSFHALYRLRDDLSLRAAFSESVNRPKFDELSPFEQEDNNKIVFGNPDLKPAHSFNFDVGGEYFNSSMMLGINLFRKEISNILEEVDTGLDKGGKDIFRVENVGDGWTHGIELEQRINLAGFGIEALAGMTLWSNQTLLDSELKDSSGLKRPFKQQPKFIANLGMDYLYVPWGSVFTVSVSHIGKRTEDNPNGDVKSTDPSWIVNISARQALYKNISAFAEINNITNEGRNEKERFVNQTSARSHQGLGRTFLVGLRIQV